MTTVLLATDSDSLFDQVDDVLGDDSTIVVRARSGAEVVPMIGEHEPDLVILDLQIGNMGGMATCIDIRHEEAADRIPITAVMMLLDRDADRFLARRADADGWLVKPLDAYRLVRSSRTLIDGYSYFEGDQAEQGVGRDDEGATAEGAPGEGAMPGAVPVSAEA